MVQSKISIEHSGKTTSSDYSGFAFSVMKYVINFTLFSYVCIFVQSSLRAGSDAKRLRDGLI